MRISSDPWRLLCNNCGKVQILEVILVTRMTNIGWVIGMQMGIRFLILRKFPIRKNWNRNLILVLVNNQNRNRNLGSILVINRVWNRNH